MSEPMQDLLDELGKSFQLPLHIDRHHACSIRIPPVTIQMQLDEKQENFVLFCKVIELPPGKFRENVLRDALKANALPDPRPGIFGFIAASDHLALHQRYPLVILDKEKLAGVFGAFFEMATLWHKAIQSGQTAPLPETKL